MRIQIKKYFSGQQKFKVDHANKYTLPIRYDLWLGYSLGQDAD